MARARLGHKVAAVVSVVALGVAGLGAPALADDQAPVAPDTTAPTLLRSNLVSRTGEPLGTSPALEPASGFSYVFAGSDDSGPVTFDVAYQTHSGLNGFGEWVQPATWTHLTRRGVAPYVAGGTTMCFRVRAVDAARNASAWSVASCVIAPLDDRKLTRKGHIKHVKDRLAVGRKVAVMPKGSSMVKRNQRAHGVYVIARRGPREGNVTVYIGKKKIGTVHFKSSTRGYVGLLVQSRTERTGDVRLVSASKRQVHLDGIALLP